MKGSGAFSRMNAIVAAMAAMMATGVKLADAASKAGLATYKSRGHGKGKISKQYYTRGIKYPEQSTRQHNRMYRRAQGGPGLDANNAPRITA